MTYELMSVQVEINPVTRAAAFRATQDVAVEIPRFCDVAHLNGNVKRCQWHISSVFSMIRDRMHLSERRNVWRPVVNRLETLTPHQRRWAPKVRQALRQRQPPRQRRGCLSHSRGSLDPVTPLRRYPEKPGCARIKSGDQRAVGHEGSEASPN